MEKAPALEDLHAVLKIDKEADLIPEQCIPFACFFIKWHNRILKDQDEFVIEKHRFKSLKPEILIVKATLAKSISNQVLFSKDYY